MATATLSVVFMGLAGFVLQDPSATMTTNPVTVALVDGAQVSETQHHPVLVVDLDLVESADGMPTGVNDDALQANKPYTVADPTRPGKMLLVWPLEGLSVSFENLTAANQMPLDVGRMPNLYKAANDKGSVASVSLDLTRNNLLLALVTLQPGVKLAQEGGTTSERWCFSSRNNYLDYFYTAASYSAAFDISKQVKVAFSKALLRGASLEGFLKLRKAKCGETFRLAISNDATIEHDRMTSDNLHAQALCALVGLKPEDSSKCPWPMRESGGMCASGGGSGTGLGCSPFIIKGN